MPLILFGKEFWRSIINLEALAEFGTISPSDLELMQFVDTAEEAWDIIESFYERLEKETAPGTVK